MARDYKRYLPTIAVVTSDALSADTVSTTSPTEISLISSGNADGCSDCEIYATVAGSTADTVTGVKIWASTSEDGTNYTKKEYVFTIPCKDETGTVKDGMYSLLMGLTAKYTKLYCELVDYAGTVTLEAAPYYHADA